MSKTTTTVYEFGSFRFDTKEHTLLCNGKSLPLTPKSFKTLLVLVENGGHVVGRSKLLDEVWPNSFVEEANLTQQVFILRRVLGIDHDGSQFIETVPKLGYRFALPVREVMDEAGNIAAGSEVQSPVNRNDTPPDKTIDSIAVLPLANASKDPDMECLGDGIIESIISNLAQLPRLRVMASSTVFRYKGRAVDPQKIGRKLHVRAIVTGRMIKLDDDLIFRVELVDVVDGSQLFGKEYKRRHCSTFDVQEEIAGTISRELQIRLAIENENYLPKHHAGA